MILDTNAFISFALLGAIVVLLIWLIRLEFRLKRLLTGRNGASLEQIITELGKTVAQTDETNEAIKKHLINMEERLQKSIQHVKTIRFNPFPDQGGKQSFATAFLDSRGNGAVISSLYSREKVNIYGKPVIDYQSEYELSNEEREAITPPKVSR